MTGRSAEPNFAFLFGGMVVLLLGVPVVETVLGRPDTLIGQIGTATLLMSGLWTLAVSSVAFRIGSGLVVLSIATTGAAMLRPAPCSPLMAPSYLPTTSSTRPCTKAP